VQELCSLVGPAHGYAGLAVVAHPAGIDDEASRAIYALGARYRGLEIDFPVHHEPFLASQHLIKGVNWLTVLGSHYEAQLGGRDALAKALAPLVSTKGWSSPATATAGVMLRAGTRPALGDVRAHEPMPSYERAARVVRPIRSVHPALIWPQGAPGFDLAAATAWMVRFDGP
jgi:hypothetical protein